MVNKPINNMNLDSFSSLRLVRGGPDFHRRFISFAGCGPILGRDRTDSILTCFDAESDVLEYC